MSTARDHGDRQRPRHRLDVLAETETADLDVTPGCLDASVGRRIVGKPPAEGRAVEVLSRIHIGDCDLDIVDCVVHGRQ